MSIRFARLPSIRYIFLALGAIFLPHLIISLSSPAYVTHTSLGAVKSLLLAPVWGTSNRMNPVRTERIESNHIEDHDSGFNLIANDNAKLPLANLTSARRANAAFVILVRNSELWEMLSSLRAMEGQQDPSAWSDAHRFRPGAYFCRSIL
jgi:hypothetical protein